MAGPASGARAEIPLTYCRVWDDDFGARGWKLSAYQSDPAVIASTAYTGDQIPTSVLIHDCLDHHLCGFPISGHRNEARALMQLHLRTGSDITRDYAQMVDEDLIHGRVNGERLTTFLPADLRHRLPTQAAPDRERMGTLIAEMGRERVRERLIQRFFELGREGVPRGRRRWEATGLAYERRAAVGLALQRLLEQGDGWVADLGTERARARYVIAPGHCRLHIQTADGTARVLEATVGP